MPLIGVLGGGSPAAGAHLAARLRQGLADGGSVEGRNVAVEFRWVEGQYDRLPAMAAELVRNQVAVIIAIFHLFGPRGKGCDRDHSHRIRRH